ncbi:hypothetical protein ACOACO_03520 [Nocardioides sp. CPCC 205120]|uniref:hypothetical protein n=1 Tax=Nocardioides sp. CPCC 205120 TaxID=3406462 RepID=UPI003B5109FD
MATTTVFDGVVDTDHHQFLLVDPSKPFDPGPEAYGNAVVGVVDDTALIVHTGCAYGPVRVTLRMHDEQPSGLDHTWEVEELVSITIDDPLDLVELAMEPRRHIPYPTVVPSRPGVHRVRVSARGDRKVNYDLAVWEPNEEYLIDLWPDTEFRTRVTVRDDGLADL